MLRDRIVWGINHEKTQNKLLSEKTLTYAKALEIVQAQLGDCSTESEGDPGQGNRQLQRGTSLWRQAQRTQGSRIRARKKRSVLPLWEGGASPIQVLIPRGRVSQVQKEGTPEGSVLEQGQAESQWQAKANGKGS